MEDKKIDILKIPESDPGGFEFDWCCHVGPECVHCTECRNVISCRSTYSKCTCKHGLHGKTKEDETISYDEDKMFKWNKVDDKAPPTNVLLLVSDGEKVWSAINTIEYHRDIIENRYGLVYSPYGFARWSDQYKKISWETPIVVEDDDHEYDRYEEIYDIDHKYWSYIPEMPKH